jgi:hypothetical protein
MERYVRAWQLADIEGFVQLIAEDVQFSMPPLTAWFQGRDAVAAFVENAIPPSRSAAGCLPRCQPRLRYEERGGIPDLDQG